MHWPSSDWSSLEWSSLNWSCDWSSCVFSLSDSVIDLILCRDSSSCVVFSSFSSYVLDFMFLVTDHSYVILSYFI